MKVVSGKAGPREARLGRMVRWWAERPKQSGRIAADISRRFEEDLAILITDFKSFSEWTERYGIIHFLSLIERARRILDPMVDSYRGDLLKWEADSLFAVFPSARDAVHCAVAMNLALEAYNRTAPADRRLLLCSGVGYGPMLRTERDCWGSQVNRASKLGEDTAREHEILLTGEAHAAVRGDRTLRFARVSPVIVGRLRITTYQVLYRGPGTDPETRVYT
ncbi:MAG: adenylate/guanylate cyclase domain-containing protein [Planctomycetes bacterium]|nr:adenylate/guanylate cyclase domain-containing protein [Planctomycetota bacterium]